MTVSATSASRTAAGATMNVTGSAGMTRAITPDSAWNRNPPRTNGAAITSARPKLLRTRSTMAGSSTWMSGQPPAGRSRRLSASRSHSNAGRPSASTTATPARCSRFPIGCGAISFETPMICDSDAVCAMAVVAMSSAIAISRTIMPSASPVTISAATSSATA